ncbi:MAG: glycoside hydrolase family 88 protein [Treponema sp.]|nr:glycoside hydrolase family 88 protein [Treponema sp.]
MQKNENDVIQHKFSLLAESFQKVLYEDDVTFLENMRKKNVPEAEIKKYQFWEWTQGVGLYGFWKYFEYTHNTTYLDILKAYYDRQLQIGLPGKNVNTVAPLLPLSFLAEYTGNEQYMAVCKEWAQWIIESFPRTKEGGFQHITSDCINDQEIWDDTLFMTVLFLANMSRILKNETYKQEAIYQFMVHAKYLADRTTGLWYHGWTFKENNNFAGAFWGRGNCWITAAIPEFLSIVDCPEATRMYLMQLLQRQVESLARYQDEGGMWHTLIDDKTSYVETSATCGFAYGIVKAAAMKLIDHSYVSCAQKALDAVLANIDESGVVSQVSYGTPMGRLTKDFYKEIPIKAMPYGQALAMLFLLEVIKGGLV